MPSQVEVFKEFLRDKYEARRYESTEPGSTELLAVGRAYAEALQNSEFTKHGSPVTYVDLANPSNLNACAFTRDGIDAIALFQGGGEVIEKLFNHILADPSTFPHIGNISIETKPLIRSSLITDTAWMDTVERNPVDSTRQKVAGTLRRFAFEFICAHELRHIRGGHVQYLSKHASAFSIEETESSTHLSPDEIITRQTLEMDADASAVAQGLTQILKMCSKLEEANVESTFVTLLEVWLYSVCAFFRLYAHERPFNLEEIACKVHPPPRVRLIWSLQTVQTWAFRGLLHLTSDEIFAIAGRVATRVETDFASITGGEIDVAGALTATDSRVDNHLMRLHTRYAELRSELEELSYSTTTVI